MNNNYGLAINNDVIARMTEMAALETKGVVGMGAKPVNLNSVKSIISKKGTTKGVAVSTKQGIIDIELYIKVSDDEKASDIAERVQKSVKEKLQGMTGSAVTKVNVMVTDVELAETEETEE